MTISLLLLSFSWSHASPLPKVVCMGPARLANTCMASDNKLAIEYNQLFYFKLDSWDDALLNNPSALQVYVNHVPLPYYPCVGVNKQAKKVFFKFENQSGLTNNVQKTLISLIRDDFGSIKNKHPLVLDLGTRDGKTIFGRDKVPANFIFFNPTMAWIIIVAAIVLFIVAGIILIRKGALNEKPVSRYGLAIAHIDIVKEKLSLRKFQLALWTLLICFAYMSLWIVFRDAPVLPDSVIGLLAIPIGVYAVSSLIPQDFSGYVEKINTANGAIENKELAVRAAKRKGLYGLLTDGDGDYSIAKIQYWLFTIIFAVIFVYTALFELAIYNFSAQQLTLMGLSGGGYLTGKSAKAFF